MSCGTEKMPELTAGKASDFQHSFVRAQKGIFERLHEFVLLVAHAKAGAHDMDDALKGQPAVVTTASPTGMRPGADSLPAFLVSSSLPAACRWRPATPPPCASSPLAALTMHSTGSGAGR